MYRKNSKNCKHYAVNSSLGDFDGNVCHFSKILIDYICSTNS